MNSKERVLTAIRREETDRLPIDFIARDEIISALNAHYGVTGGEDLLRCLNVDLRAIGPVIKQCVTPLGYADPTIRIERDPVTGEDVYYDIWGVGFAEKRAQGGCYFDLCHNPLRDAQTIDDLECYPFPDPDIWDYSTISAQAERHSDYAVWAHSRGFFEISWFMRGMDNFLPDLIDNREFTERLMDKIIGYLIGRTERILDVDRKGLIDFVEINDDVGGQNGMLISPRLWRELIKPRIGAMISRIKRHGKLIRYHSCGGVSDIIPDLIEIGVDILNPVQPMARGMELSGLKSRFGERITFDGGIDTQKLLPRKTGAALEEELRHILRMMGAGGGYIMAPSHALQVDVPLDNILMLYRMAAMPREQYAHAS
ncbi:MAG: hypothetical protein NTY46_09125 [Candidatus Sumerlaeota bacterium]|nr:hypothetical protein [Candidatus Sumerlaeota bacterium]